jgi:hypothetical protein
MDLPRPHVRLSEMVDWMRKYMSPWQEFKRPRSRTVQLEDLQLCWLNFGRTSYSVRPGGSGQLVLHRDRLLRSNIPPCVELELELQLEIESQCRRYFTTAQYLSRYKELQLPIVNRYQHKTKTSSKATNTHHKPNPLNKNQQCPKPSSSQAQQANKAAQP